MHACKYNRATMMGLSAGVGAKIGALPLLGLLLMLGCNLGCNKDDDELQSRTPPPVVEEELGDSFQAGQHWVLKQVMTTNVVLPFVGETSMSAQSQNFMIIDMVQEGESLYQYETYCWSDFEEVAGMRTYLPDAFYNSLEGTLREGTLSDLEVGATYSAPDYLTVYGAELTDPSRDPLPSELSDSRVIDEEGDGAPGFTAVVTGWMGDADVYMTQRTFTTMTGQVISSTRIEGTITNSLEQNILDATTWWAALEGFESVPSGVPEQNFFIMLALDEPITCEELEQTHESLFP